MLDIIKAFTPCSLRVHSVWKGVCLSPTTDFEKLQKTFVFTIFFFSKSIFKKDPGNGFA